MLTGIGIGIGIGPGRAFSSRAASCSAPRLPAASSPHLWVLRGRRVRFICICIGGNRCSAVGGSALTPAADFYESACTHFVLK
jgi:hypothetical protein